jgi:hypothetical protein
MSPLYGQSNGQFLDIGPPILGRSKPVRIEPSAKGLLYLLLLIAIVVLGGAVSNLNARRSNGVTAEVGSHVSFSFASDKPPLPESDVFTFTC